MLNFTTILDALMKEQVCHNSKEKQTQKGIMYVNNYMLACIQDSEKITKITKFVFAKESITKLTLVIDYSSDHSMSFRKISMFWFSTMH